MLTYQRAGHALGITRTTIYLQEGLGIYEVDLEALQAAEPDLLLSQAICEVCAISSRQVTECSLRLAKTPQILSLDPQYVGDVLNDIRRVAAATDTSARGEEIVASLQCRIAAVAERAAQATTRPRVLHLEWAEPVMCGGHWVPEMVEMAGGVNCFGDKETGSFRLDWDAVVESQPEMIILMLCGYTAQRSLEDVPILAAKPGWDDLPAVRHNQIFAIDAGAYTSRSGPRLVQGLEIIAEILHPELFFGCIPADGAVRVDSTLARIGVGGTISRMVMAHAMHHAPAWSDFTHRITTARDTHDVRGLHAVDCPRAQWITEKLGEESTPWTSPVRRTLAKCVPMRRSLPKSPGPICIRTTA